MNVYPVDEGQIGNVKEGRGTKGVGRSEIKGERRKNVKSETEVCTDVREYACIKSHGRTSRKRSRKSKKKEIQSHVYRGKKAEE